MKKALNVWDCDIPLITLSEILQHSWWSISSEQILYQNNTYQTKYRSHTSRLSPLQRWVFSDSCDATLPLSAFASSCHLSGFCCLCQSGISEAFMWLWLSCRWQYGAFALSNSCFFCGCDSHATTLWCLCVVKSPVKLSAVVKKAKEIWKDNGIISDIK